MSSFFTMFQLYDEAENNYSLITKNYSLVTFLRPQVQLHTSNNKDSLKFIK